ncbi:hypothetical protein MCUN1_003806 [Malassezia cuniculi]|uniref:Uncharacterized protein n=1 Tax=Malassezia cuniculi TaxID=948313 RepID=A0AAF0J8J3_9BASI|nr:hypothetical protein MCUN1_003806 [Malassezia cuniculi]
MLARVLVVGIAALSAAAAALSPIEAASRLANDSSNIKYRTPDDVYRTTKLDKTVVVGSESHKGWVSPLHNNGSMMDLAGGGLREPINVIIRGDSDPYIMSDHGLLDYVRSIGFSFECLHLHGGGYQYANLGDGNGYQPQLVEYRELMFPGSPGVFVGSCWETLAGGNHFRVWRQNGTQADTGAWFLAVSKEEDLLQHHTIVPNGYDIGRDLLVKAATDGSQFAGRSWKADATV